MSPISIYNKLSTSSKEGEKWSVSSSTEEKQWYISSTKGELLSTSSNEGDK